MMSIHRRLLLGLSFGLLLLFLFSGALFYFCIEAVLARQFDAALVAQADAICNLIKLQPNGEVELELPQRSVSPFRADAHLNYFQIWREDGSVLMRSSTLGTNDLPHSAAADTPVFANTFLATGHPGRVIELRFVPVVEDEDVADGNKLQGRRPQASATFVTVAVAQDRSELDRIMALLLSALLVVAVCVVIGSVAMVSMVVRRGLGPLKRVAHEAAHIDAQSLDFRFSLDGLPSELQPICLRLNDSLERLQQTFQRERRFTADVAHELRTPIAELRSLADVALKWDADRETSLAYFRDAQEIAQQMERIVTNLLSLARCHSGMMTIARESVNLNDVVRDAWDGHQQEATERHLAVTFDLPKRLLLETDRTMLYSILSNLLANAAQYTRIGGTVACKAVTNGSAMQFMVTNDTDCLSPDDLPHLFEAFWRKDAARTDGLHCGLGLTLVDTYVAVLGGKVEVSLQRQDSLCVALSLPLTGQ